MSDERKIKINPNIDIGEILNVVTTLGAILTFAFMTGQKIENHEIRLKNVELRSAEDRAHMDQRFNKIEDLIRNVSDKVEKKADRS